MFLWGMNDDEKMSIFARSLTGEEYKICVNPKDKVLMLKYEIAQKYDIEIRLQRLIYCGQEMENDCAINFYDVASQTVIHLVIIDEPSVPSSLIETVFNMEIAFKKLRKKCERLQTENASLKEELAKIKKEQQKSPNLIDGSMSAL